MSIAVTEDQRELASAASGFVARYAPTAHTREAFAELAAGKRPDHWSAMIEQGLHTVHLAEEDGGQGGGLPELAVVLEEAGRGLLPGPFLPTVLASAVASLAPAGPARSALLGVLSGGGTAALVLPDKGLTAQFADATITLTGRTGPVLGLLGAEVLVVGARSGDTTVWVRLDPAAEGVTRIAEEGVDLTRDVGRLELDAVVVDTDLGAIDPEAAAAVVTALSAAEASGVMAWCVRSAVEYVMVREQFGRPVGSFQAVKHKAARLFVAAELASASAWDAVRGLGQEPEQRRLAVGGAAVVALGRATDAALEAITLFGGIGFTWEHDVHLYWRRAMSLAALTGPVANRLVELGEAALTTRREGGVDLGPDDDPAFRARIGAILDAAPPAPEAVDGRWRAGDTSPWRTHLADAGLVSPHWPAPWGLAATPPQQLMIAEEFARRGLVQPSTVIGEWAMPTILAHGTPEQAERFALPTLRGDIVWCQLFSEPGAGSDLAGLATRAVKVEGGWQLDGQKVWNSGAHEADWGICLARTDPEVPKHKGITYFLVDMRSPGVDVRPLKQATGASEFNEVFLNGVFVPDDLMVGQPGEGWRLTMTTLGNERTSISSTLGSADEEPIRELIRKGAYATSREEALRTLGQVHAYGTAASALGLRETLRRLAGQQPGAGSSVAKVATAQLHRDAAELTLALVGPEAAVRGGVDAARTELAVPAQLIGGGTVEIQLNVIAERVLRLPRG